MKVRDVYSGEEYDVLTLEQFSADRTVRSNDAIEADKPAEFLVEVTSPSGDAVLMSVVAETKFLVNADGAIHVKPASDPAQFEEVTNG